MNMIENVAKAMMAQCEDRMRSSPFAPITLDGEEDFMALAKAAIETMREPTPEMVDAPYLRQWAWGAHNDASGARDMREAWQQMIDTALIEGST